MFYDDFLKAFAFEATSCQDRFFRAVSDFLSSDDGEFAELLFCHIVNVVDKGLRVTTMDDIFEVDKQKALYRGLG